MTENITQMRIEDAIDGANTFLERERGALLDGADATQAVRETVVSEAEAAEEILTKRPVKGRDGFYAPLSKINAADFSRVAYTLRGYMVLVPAPLAGDSVSEFYAAVVSEQNATQDTGSMRLHVFKQPYRRTLSGGVRTVLSASGQSETKGVGSHGHKDGDGVEAEHFATIITAGSDPVVQQQWQAGEHINHQWRKQPNTSVTTEMSRRLFGAEIPQTTITITKKDVEAGKAGLLWHEGMRREEENGAIETATRENALVVVQALGLEALKNSSPSGLDNVKRLIHA